MAQDARPASRRNILLGAAAGLVVHLLRRKPEARP